MSGFARTIKAIFAKDLLTELRARQMLPTMIMLGILIAWVFRLAGPSAQKDASPTAAAVMLVAVLFAAILTSEKAFAVEQQNDSISALLLAPIDAGHIYIAKMLVNVVMLCIFEVVTVPVILVLFKVTPGARWPGLILVLLLCNLGMAGLGTLLGSLVQGTRAAASLLSILVMAALCPMMIPAIAALLSLLGPANAGSLGAGAWGVAGSFNAAVGYIAAFDAIFVTVCWLLFGFVVRQ